LCTNYAPSKRDVAESMMPLVSVSGEWPAEVFRDFQAPLIRRVPLTHAAVDESPSDGRYELLAGNYSLVPQRFMSPARKFSTMNCRMEDVGQRRNYASAWRAGQLCLLPTAHYYEWLYQPGKKNPERWAIGVADGSDFCIAGLWRDWPDASGETFTAFAQFTANADQHALLSQFHRPEDEKRAVVIMPRENYDDWLNCHDPEFARSMLQLLPADQLRAWPAPKKKSEGKAPSS
jgi:putative SOS response-associated peptidase YedK